MNDNPILVKDTLLSNRGLFLPLLISITNLVLFIVLIGNLYYISLNLLSCGSRPFSLSASFSAGYYRVQLEHRGTEYAGASSRNRLGQ